MLRTDTGWRIAGLALAWLAGVALHLQQAALPPAAAHVGAIAAGLSGLACAWRWRQGFVAGVLGAALLGFGVSGWHASMLMADALAPAFEGQDLALTGVVATLPQQSAAGLRFRFDVEQASWRGEPVHVPAQIALGWYRGFHEDAAQVQPRQSLRAGQRWSFTARLRRPHGTLNPYGFDYELQLFEQGLRATGYVRDAPARLVDAAAGHAVERLRQRVRDAIDARVADRRAAGVLAALSIGDQAAIERDDWELYRNAGIAHLMSISGLHVTMFAWLAGLAVAAAWRRSPRAMERLAAPLAARWGGLLAAAAYAVFSGWGVPSQRTVWMLAAVAVLRSSGVHWGWPLVLLGAAVVVTAVDPWALLQPGFWLSFAAVGLLMASAPAHASTPDSPAAPGWRSRLARELRQGLRTQVVATLGLTPLTLVFFQQVSLVGFGANLVAIPLVTLVITPLALLGVAFGPLWSLAAWVIGAFNAVLGALTALPSAVWRVPVAPLWAQCAGLLGAALWILPLPWRLRALGIGLVLPLAMPPRELPPQGSFDLLAADVGQGSALVLRTHAHVLVFDAGPSYSRESDAGQRVLLPLLRAFGAEHVDRLVLSHRDADHVGGARAVLGGARVDEIVSSLEADHPLLALGARATRCEAGQRWVWDGVRFDMLWPPASDYERAPKSNALSCVLRVQGAPDASAAPGATGASGSVLLTGDIEAAQEAALVASHAAALASEVLIVPHHGSKTSSSAAFLDAVRPRSAVVQAGYRNRFGHPAADVLARYDARGVRVLASPACGAWFWSTGESAAGTCRRDAVRRYWHCVKCGVD